MSRRLADTQSTRSPKARVKEPGAAAAVALFPKEVAVCLNIERISYDQLRRFYLIIRNPGDDDEKRALLEGKWARWSFTDLACLVAALELCGGTELLAPGRRHTLGDLREACSALYAQGFEIPLLNVDLRRIGRRFFVRHSGVLVDVATGQTAIDETADALNRSRYFDGSLLSDPSVAAALEAEIERHRISLPTARPFPPPNTRGTMDS